MSSAPFRITELWRHPVKSMGGESLDELELSARGVHGDRLWALHDVERDTTISARRLPAVLRFSARFAAPPGPDAGPGRAPAVIITAPDGSEHHSDDPQIHAALSTRLGRDVRLVPLPDDPRAHRLSWRERMSSLTPDALARDLGIRPDEKLPKVSDMNARALATLTRNATPPGSFVDLCPVHLITETSLSTIATAMGVDHLDARRFRPNVVLAGGPPADVLPESAWPDTALDVGGARLHVVMRTVRCVVPSHAHGDLPVEAALTRAVAGTADRYLGVYADVTTAGRIRVGDTLTITPPTPPSPTRRLARRGRVLALDSANRLIEMLRRD